MINNQLNTILHKHLDNKVKEKFIVDLIESFVIEKHYYFRFQDHERGDVHHGVISKSFKNKFDKTIKLNKKKYPKKIWKNIEFYKYNHYPIDNEYTEISVRTRCTKSFRNGKGYFLFKRNQTILDRLYFILFISRNSIY